jgi:hypothetical protein
MWDIRASQNGSAILVLQCCPSNSKCLSVRPWWTGRQHRTRLISLIYCTCNVCSLWMNDGSLIIWCSGSHAIGHSSPAGCSSRWCVGESLQFVAGLSGLFCRPWWCDSCSLSSLLALIGRRPSWKCRLYVCVCVCVKICWYFTLW